MQLLSEMYVLEDSYSTSLKMHKLYAIMDIN